MLPFFVWQNKVLKKIRPEDLVFMSAEENYTKMFFADGTSLMVRSPLTEALKKLSPEIFLRTHRSYAVSIYYMDEVNRDHVVVAGAIIPIGKQYYQGLVERLNVID